MEGDPFMDELDELMDEYYRSGDVIILLRVFLDAARFGRVPPGEACDELREKLERYNAAECKTLDEALGVQRKKHWKQPAEHAKRGLYRSGSLVMSKIGCLWHRAQALKAAGMHTDEGLWEQLGREFNLSPSRARDWYYESKRHIEAPDAKQ